MAHINGPIDWRPIEEYQPDGTIVYGFFSPHTPDNGLHAHVRPVRRYRADGDWFCGVTSHNLGFHGPIMFTEKIPYPTREQVRSILQTKLDKSTAAMEERNPHLAVAGAFKPVVPPLTF